VRLEVLGEFIFTKNQIENVLNVVLRKISRLKRREEISEKKTA
jgi:hypothetical protein